MTGVDAAAKAFLEEDTLAHMDMLQPIRRGVAEVIAADGEGVLLRERISCALFLSARTPRAAERMLALTEPPALLAVHQDFAAQTAERLYALRPMMTCRQAVWTRPEPPKAPSTLAIRALSPEWAPRVAALYAHDCPLAYIEGRLASGALFGTFAEDELAGFIGIHEEGSMGMLEVVPAFRRQGVASRLVTFLCDRLLAEGLTPFSQFTVENAASRMLHERLGFALAKGRVRWLQR